jgi:hypothetical protein
MASSSCPACRSKISLIQVLRAPTPLHLKCGNCQTRLRAHPALEWSALGVAVVGGIAIGHIAVSSGLRAALPVFGGVAAFELAAAIAVAKLSNLEPRP